MSRAATSLVCTGCGHVASAEEALPFRCPSAGDGRDHVLARSGPPDGARLPADGDDEPFVRYRALSHAYDVALAHGLDDAGYVALVRAHDHAVREVDGHGFQVTPYREAPELAEALGLKAPGGLWVKDETGNVAGSHKARHLFGLALWLEVAERTGLAPADLRERPLAIASCGNAALAAAVVARAAGRPLRVFVPPDAETGILSRLEALGAAIETCPRLPDDPPGDPCHHRFRAAVGAGALPFSCQGSDNGLTIDGGMTLGFEIATQHAALGAESLDRVIVQVGGGALASAVTQALAWAQALGAMDRRPAMHAVQTEGGFPVVRAWRRVARGLIDELGGTKAALPANDDATGQGALTADAAAAKWLSTHMAPSDVDAAMTRAASDRPSFMWPWQPAPRSAATGILDDETYDWLAVVRGMLETGGFPVVAAETTIAGAADRAHDATGIAVSSTGAAGLAGALELARAGLLGDTDRVALLLTGAKR